MLYSTHDTNTREHTMCGIAGFSISERDTIDARRLTEVLLRGIEPRGRDATGVAWHDANERQTWVQKRNVAASKQIKTGLEIDTATKTAVMHTRWATKGDPRNNDNNHPIDVPGVVLVHNGVCTNDDEIFRMLADHDVKREAVVDSEAIAALLAYGPTIWNDATPDTLLPLVSGSAAVAWLRTRGRPDVLHLARLSSSPLIIGQTTHGSLLFASTRSAVISASLDVRAPLAWLREVSTGTYLRVRAGTITDWKRFEAQPYRRPHKPQYSRKSRYERGAHVTPIRVGTQTEWEY